MYHEFMHRLCTPENFWAMAVGAAALYGWFYHVYDQRNERRKRNLYRNFTA